MKHLQTRTRCIVVGIFLFGIVVGTAYLQSIFHFNTYLALTICLLDTLAAAAVLLG